MSRRLLAVVLVASLALASGCDALRIRANLTKGNRAYKAQKYDDAIGFYKKILEVDPDHFLGNYLTAMSNLAMYHPGSTHEKDKAYAQNAIAALEKTMKLPPPDAETPEKLERYYLSLLTAAGQDAKAVQYLEGEVAKNPKNIPALSQLAQYYAKEASGFPKALATFERIAGYEPAKKEHWYTLGVVAWERSYKGGTMVSDEEREELIKKGFAWLDKSLAIDPDYFEAISYVNLLHREQAKVYANRQDLESAQVEFQKAELLVRRALDARKKKMALAEKQEKEKAPAAGSEK
jgi:tetratricopeptide (TPR) repeat protein